MENEAIGKYHQINSEIDSLSKLLTESTATDSWLRGRKFNPSDGSESFTLNKITNQLKKLNQEMKNLQPDQSNEGEFSEYLDAKKKILGLVDLIHSKDAEHQPSKITGLAIRRFGIPSLIRQRQLNEITAGCKGDIRKLQDDMRTAITKLEEKILENEESTRQLVYFDDAINDLSTILSDRDPGETRSATMLPPKFNDLHKLDGEDVHNSYELYKKALKEDYSNDALESLKAKLTDEKALREANLEKPGELEEKLLELESAYQKLFGTK